MNRKSVDEIPQDVIGWYENAFFQEDKPSAEFFFPFAQSRALYCTSRIGYHYGLNNDWEKSEWYEPSQEVRDWVFHNKLTVIQYLIDKEFGTNVTI